MFDLMLGGGWAQGRIINLVGDKSSGKTLLAIEACINWKQTAGVGSIRYAEAEAAFDEDYARSLGMPEGVAFAQVHTVEQFYLDLEGWLDTQVSGKPCLYILDSLDSLSDDKEMAQEIGAPSYGALKAKRMSETFRKLTQKIESSNCTLFVISQIRDKIGVTFGETKTRSGGKALDFYASQIVWLAELQKIKKTSRGIERTIGTRVLARTKKNKVGMPYRDCELAIIFGYGVDDEESMISWITKNKAESLMPDGLTTKQAREDIKDAREVKDRETVDAINRLLFQVVETRWKQVEHDIAPRMSKYAD
jgi:recombination protein RecA